MNYLQQFILINKFNKFNLNLFNTNLHVIKEHEL